MKTLTAALLALGLAATFAAPASAEPCARKNTTASTQTDAVTGT
ncbi:hypothetical protein HNR47_003434 [Methylopila jiangsuensis]|nr:hypothetical protein [Methylopila jiangsuensis]MDR6287404.1 hypothetical protein [Methylopila jiangsuensis]